MVLVQNLLAPLCFVFGKDILRQFFLIDDLGSSSKFQSYHFFFFFFFRPFPSIRGSHSVSSFSNRPIFNFRLPHTNFPHIFLHYIKNLFLGLPLFLYPGNSTSIVFLPIYSWSLLITCPYHLSLPSLIFILNRYTLNVPLLYSFLILSFLVTPIENLNIFISATSISYTCFFVTATVSSPYIIAGLTAELYTFLFTLAGNLLSQITPDTFSPSISSCLYSPLYLPLTITIFLHH